MDLYSLRRLRTVPACAARLCQAAAIGLLGLGPGLHVHEEDVVVPMSEGSLRDFGVKARDHALGLWFGKHGLAPCTTKHSGVRCSKASQAGCILNQWAVGAKVAGTQLTLEYTLPNPLQPLRPARFLEVRVDSNTQMCRMVYGHLDKRPCPVHPEWLARVTKAVGVEFVVNDVEWLGYDPAPLPDPEEGEEVTERDPFTVPRAELCFKFVHLRAVLDFFLPEVGHAKQCNCVTGSAYFRKGQRGTTVSYVPEVGMPYHFYDKQGDIRATFGVVFRNIKDHGGVRQGSALAPTAVDLVPAYIPTDCIGFFPDHHNKSGQQCESCHKVMHTASTKASRVRKLLQDGTYITIHGESIFVPKTNNADILSATLGPFGKVRNSPVPRGE